MMVVGRSYGGWVGVLIGLILILAMNYFVRIHNDANSDGRFIQTSGGKALYDRILTEFPLLNKDDCREFDGSSGYYIECGVLDVRSIGECDAIVGRLLNSGWRPASNSSSCQSSIRLQSDEILLDMLYFRRSNVVRLTLKSNSS